MDRPISETSTWQHTTFTRKTTIPSVGFEPAIPASGRPQTHALDRAATGDIHGNYILEIHGGQGSSGGTVTRYELSRLGTENWGRGGAEIFSSRPDRPCGSPSLLYNGYRVFLGGKAAGALRSPPQLSGAKVWTTVAPAQACHGVTSAVCLHYRYMTMSKWRTDFCEYIFFSTSQSSLKL